jgi:aminopeptidase N
MRRLLLSLALMPLVARTSAAQEKTKFSHADSLRGTNSPQRSWWDVSFYDLHVAISPSDSTIRGYNVITYRVLRPAPAQEMQIDLQMPLIVDSMVQDGKPLTFKRDSNAFVVTLPAPQIKGTSRAIGVYYHGRPRVAKRPPWDGGYGWGVDSLGRTYFSTTNEGLGASVWWPTKDIPSDEPDSQRIAITIPDPSIDVSNGRLRSTVKNADGTTTYEWFVANPINNYDVAVNAGRYEHFTDSYKGEAGNLTLDFWPLSYHLDEAKRQFAQVKPMLACFEKWFGPYPWYADGYKLVETAHLGMEHQSAVAYGNGYANGYRRKDPSQPGSHWVDLSHTGLGLEWDFIIVHESAHEWWGNNISAGDHADMWIHESFANYSENLFEECQKGKEAGARYVIGTRANVTNDAPIIGHYSVNNEGSGDMYYKGGNMLHTIRQIINDDTKWRAILRGLNTTFRHGIVSGHDIEDYINTKSGINFDKVFTQYLMTTRVPTFEYDILGGTLWYRWSNVIPGFDMPIRAHTMEGRDVLLRPTEKWKSVRLDISADAFKLDENFYVRPMRVAK